MNRRFLSTVAPPPPGFAVEPLTKRVLLGGAVAIFTNDADAVYGALERFAERVTGIVVLAGEAFEQQAVGPLLWRVQVPDRALPDLLALASGHLALLEQAATFQEARHFEAQMTLRARRELEGTRRDYNLITHTLQNQVAALTAAQQALSESETRLRAIIETTADPIDIKDPGGHYMLVNPAFARLVGRPMAAAVGQAAEAYYPAERNARGRAIERAILAGGEATTYEEEGEGEDRVFLTTKLPWRDPDGRLLGLISIRRDISDFRKAERERIEARAREQKALAEAEAARKLDAAKSAFLDSVSHELRTPLTSIKGYAELLEDNLAGPLSDEQTTFVRHIQNGARRLQNLVDDLLDSARLDAGTFRLVLGDADLAQEVREVVASMRPQVDAAHLKVELDLSEGPSAARFDARRIGQVLTNLFSNAIKFTPEGGTIRVAVRREADRLRCTIADSGAGIARADMPRLFRRFEQLASGMRTAGGTGLGLNITKSLVEAHGGEIGVESIEGRGATFWFTLPTENAPPATGATAHNRV